jgi:hypothetical protein
MKQKKLITIFLVITLSTVPLNAAYSKNKPDPKVIKDCEIVNESFDNKSYFLFLSAPLSKNRDLARLEIDKKELAPSLVLIECDKVDMKTWMSIKSDYISVIKKANIELKKIVSKYKFLPMITLTCVKNGKITKVESTNPKCPTGFKELYK